MKKNLLLASGLLLIASASFAQGLRVPAHLSKMKPLPVEANTETPTTATPRPVRTPVAHTSNRTTAVLVRKSIGTASNSYGVFYHPMNQVSYNPDINAIAFGHRGGGTKGGASGKYTYDLSLDGGDTWTSQLGPSNTITPTLDNANTVAARYPNCAIWNPAGNTDPANARVVGAGPGLNLSPAQFAWEYWCSAKLTDGSAANTGTYQDADQNNFRPVGLTSGPQGIFYMVNRRQDNITHIVKLERDNANDKFNRVVKYTIAPDSCATPPSTAFTYDIAFSPDGQTGYALYVDGSLDQPDPFYGVTPILYKSNDAGETWNKQASLDYAQLPALMDSTLGCWSSTTGIAGPAIPVMWRAEMVVDNAGKCHVFAEMGSRSALSLDSLVTGTSVPVFSGAGAFRIYHFVTDGTTWGAKHILQNDNTDFTFGAISHDISLQAGRSVDGTRVFCSVSKTVISDPTVAENSAPDVFVYGYRTTDGQTMPFFNLTDGQDGSLESFWQKLSPVVIGSNGTYTLPIVFTTPGAADTDPIMLNYYAGATVTDADFTRPEFVGMTATACNACTRTMADCLVTGTTATTSLNSLVSIMPNPTEGVLRVDISNLTAAAEITVTDVLGKQILQLQNQTGVATLNLSNQANGIYFVTVRSTEGIATKKVNVIK